MKKQSKGKSIRLQLSERLGNRGDVGGTDKSKSNVVDANREKLDS